MTDGRMGTTFKISNDKREFSQPRKEMPSDSQIAHVDTTSDDLMHTIDGLSLIAVNEAGINDTEKQSVPYPVPVVSVASNSDRQFLTFVKRIVQETIGSATTQNISELNNFANKTQSQQRTSLFLRNLERCQSNNDKIVFDCNVERKIKNPKYMRISSFIIKLWRLELTGDFNLTHTLNNDHPAYDLLFDFLHFGTVTIHDGKQLARDICFLFSMNVASPYITAMLAIHAMLNLSFISFASFLEGCMNLNFGIYTSFVQTLILLFCVDNGLDKKLSDGNDGDFSEIQIIVFQERNEYVEFIKSDMRQNALKADTSYSDFKPCDFPYLWQLSLSSLLREKGSVNVLKNLLKDVFNYKMFANLSIPCEKDSSKAFSVCEQVLCVFLENSEPKHISGQKIGNCEGCSLKAYRYVYQTMLDEDFFDAMPEFDILPDVMGICEKWQLHDKRAIVTNSLSLLDVAKRFPESKEVLLPFMLNVSLDPETDIQTFLRYSKEWFKKDIAKLLNLSTISTILRSDNLYALDELEIVKICYEWAKHNESMDGAPAKSHFKKVKKFLRFPLVDANFIHNEILEMDVFEPGEADAIILNSVFGTSRNSGYSDIPRRYTQRNSPKAAGFLRRCIN